jgi:hypothetical protein
LLHDTGFFGLLGTNTIAQGDSREVALEQLLANTGCIIRGHSSRKWPGTANLEVAQVWYSRCSWSGTCVLDDTPVGSISAHLRPVTEGTGKPYVLKASSDKAFQGAIVLGTGFILDPGDARKLIEDDVRYKDALFPYLTGEDFNSSPNQSPTRWIINFFGWPLSRDTAPPDYTGPVAADYPRCLEIVERLVKPERMKYEPKNAWNKKARSQWWLFGQWRWALSEAIATMKQVLVRSRVSNINSIGFAPANYVFADTVVVFAFDDMGHFALLQSFAHTVWLEEYSSSMRTDVRYTPSSCFDNLAMPRRWDAMAAIGSQYCEYRYKVMDSHQEGLTKTYNRFHNPEETSADIQKLRQIHVEMDHAVAAAYGWTDIDLGHDFHKTKQGLRYTISDPARREVLARLLKLNHERYAEEVRQGLHEKKPRNTRKTRKKEKEGGAHLPFE